MSGIFYESQLRVLMSGSIETCQQVSGGLIAVCACRLGTATLAAAAAVTLLVVQRRRRCAGSPTVRVASDRSLFGTAASLEGGELPSRSAMSKSGNSGIAFALLHYVRALSGLLLPQEAAAASAADSNIIRGGPSSGRGLSGAVDVAGSSRDLTLSRLHGSTGRATSAGGAVVAAHEVRWAVRRLLQP